MSRNHDAEPTSQPGNQAPLWRWRALCEALGLPPADGPNVTGVSIDSRTTKPGDLFIALTGDPGPRFQVSYRSQRDGHDFIDAAVAAGAVAVMSHDGRPRQVPQLTVADTLDGLWALARAARQRLDCPVVAVTGSSGKTTLKSYLAAALDAFATDGSLNNHLGVPLSLVRTPADATAAVYEIGMNHPGEIAPLAELARPNVAVVLNVLEVHREYFSDPDGIRKEKLSIHKGLDDKGVLVLEESIDAAGVAERIPLRRFGASGDADVALLDQDADTARYRVGAETVTAHVPGGGTHRAMTVAAVLCVLQALGRPLGPALTLPDALIPAGRGRQHTVAGITVIDDSYNANPDSVRAALRGLAATAARRRFAVLGEMLELGEASAARHAALATATDGIDGIFCVGAGMQALQQALPAGRNLGWRLEADDDLLHELKQRLTAGDVVLVKGSNRVFWTRRWAQRLLEHLGTA
ncbi:MAG: UDP-N-acetylmuramoyl-tripeptide--D-alanyl-D-alanine ligase [Pseudomonadales bacterium]